MQRLPPARQQPTPGPAPCPHTDSHWRRSATPRYKLVDFLLAVGVDRSVKRPSPTAWSASCSGRPPVSPSPTDPATTVCRRPGERCRRRC